MPDPALVSTGWVAERLGTPRFRVIDVPSSGDGYASGHLDRAVEIVWTRDLIPYEDESSGHVIDPHRFAGVARRLGVRPNDTLLFYGDEGSRHAIRAFWTFAYYRHPGALHVMDGGREKWRAEARPLSDETPEVEPSEYPAPSTRDDGLRIDRKEIQARLSAAGGAFAVLDVRTREEYEGRDVRAARGGHIPGAHHVFWQEALAADGTLKPRAELERVFASVPRDATVAVHCQLGVRAAHTWFVLKHILGYDDVRNYDASWQEWGNLQDTPIDQ